MIFEKKLEQLTGDKCLIHGSHEYIQSQQPESSVFRVMIQI